jgi:NTE family protein
MKQKARVVLSGGAALGLAHIGVLKVLEQRYDITGIVGTSIGAIVGGLYASGYTPDELLDIATKNNAKRLFNPFYLDRTLSGIFDGKMIINLFQDWTKDILIENCKLPFIAISYDLVKRNTIVIGKGSLAKAMRASSSIPYLFSPYQWGKYALVDGGVEYPLPLGLGKTAHGEITIAVNVLPSKSIEPERIDTLSIDDEKNKMKLHEVFLRCIIQNQAYMALHAIADVKPDIVIDAWYPKGNVYGFDDAESFYRWGIAKAEETVLGSEQPDYTKTIRKEYRNIVTKLGKGLHKIAFDLEVLGHVKR